MKSAVFCCVLAVVALAIAVDTTQGEKRKEHRELGHHEPGHHEPGHHEGKVHKGFKAYYHEKKLKEAHHRKSYGHDDKHFHRTVKSPSKHALEVPAHEAHLQGDLKSPKGYKSHQNHDSWHKKDLHLQDISYNPHKSGAHHNPTHNPHMVAKAHHQMPQNDQPAAASHHKGPSSEERGFLHRPHKVTPSSPSAHSGHHHLQKPVQTKSFHPEQHEAKEPKKSGHHKEKDLNWSKNKKQKKAFEKKLKQKQHRKKQIKGELHKLW